MQLFDDFERARTTYAGHAEPEYEFLNTSAFRFADQVRRYTQEWFDRYPEDAKADLRGRFRSKDNEQHTSAHFELLIHELLLRLDFDVQVHPYVPTTSKRPDFLAANSMGSFYIEAHVIYKDLAERPVTQQEKEFYDWINDLDSSSFMLDLEAEGVLTEQASKRDLLLLRQLMNSHHPDAVEDLIQHRGYHAAPSVTIKVGDWKLVAHLLPLPLSDHGQSDEPTIAASPSEFGRGNFDSPVSKKLRSKVTDKRGSKLDAPLILAVKVDSRMFSLERDAPRTALGRLVPELASEELYPAVGIRRATEGVWFTLGGRPQHNNLHAIWFFDSRSDIGSASARPWSLLILNPNASLQSLFGLERVPHMRAQSGRMEHFEGVGLNQLLEVEPLDPARWYAIPSTDS